MGNDKAKIVEERVNANICEIDGAYYQVHLKWLPRVGDLIDLYSLVDAAARLPPYHRYEVVQVVHKLHDLEKEDTKPYSGGHHFVEVYVKPSQSKFFR